jgi:hypothetical protein
VTGAARLSVCCLTADDPAMVAAALGTVREAAAEIVVAVDSRVDPATTGPLRDVADTVVRFEYTEPPESARPWLVGLCRHDHVLMLDGDEVPSQDFVAALPALVADPDTAQFRLARRWCFPDERHWLAERPWWPDYQRRLLVRGPQLDFDTSVHGGARAALPARYVDEPLYHLACVLTSFADRRARARRYEALRPGFVAVGGGPMNDTLYVPEHFATVPPAPVPDDDRAILEKVLAARGSAEPATSAGINDDVPLVTAAEIAAHRPPDPLAAQGYRVTLRVVERDRRTEPGNDTLLAVAVTNEGDAPLPHRDSPGVQLRVGARLRHRMTGAVLTDWALTPLPGDIPPGESRILEALIRVPSEPGMHTVEVDLVNERARWFGSPAQADLMVASRWGRFAL